MSGYSVSLTSLHFPPIALSRCSSYVNVTTQHCTSSTVRIPCIIHLTEYSVSHPFIHPLKRYTRTNRLPEEVPAYTRCYCTPSGPSLLYAHNYSNCVAGPTFSRHHHGPETASSQPKCLDCSLNCLQCRRAAKGGPRM